MKTFLTTAVLAAGLLLSSCAALQTETCSAPKSVYDVAACARNIAVEACGWREPLGNLVLIIQNLGPGGISAVALANMVCTAANSGSSPDSRRAGVRASVAGVPLKGSFVRR